MKPRAIKLVTVEPRHIPEIQKHASEAQVAATCNLPHPYPENAAKQFYQYINDPQLSGNRATFAIQRGKEFCGVCGVGRDPGGQTGEIGYWIALPVWGQGVATEATRKLIRFAFTKFKIKTLRGRCLAENPASRRVMEKNGFRLVKVGPEQFAKWPDPQETCFYELERAEWRKSQGLRGLLAGK